MVRKTIADDFAEAFDEGVAYAEGTQDARLGYVPDPDRYDSKALRKFYMEGYTKTASKTDP